jgi:hypothetical protein
VTLRRSLAALIVAVMLGACGSGATRLSHPAFIRAWNQICAKDEAAIAHLNDRVPAEVNAETLPAYAEVFGEAARLFRMEIDHLSAVQPPKEDEMTVETILMYLEAAHAKLSRLQAAAAAGLVEPVRTSGRNESLLEARMLGQEYGLDRTCFSGGSNA